MVTEIYKIKPKIFGPSPKNSLAVFVAISGNFATWSRISPERNKTSSMGRRLANSNVSLTLQVYKWYTNGENSTEVLTRQR